MFSASFVKFQLPITTEMSAKDYKSCECSYCDKKCRNTAVEGTTLICLPCTNGHHNFSYQPESGLDFDATEDVILGFWWW